MLWLACVRVEVYGVTSNVVGLRNMLKNSELRTSCESRKMAKTGPKNSIFLTEEWSNRGGEKRLNFFRKFE